MPDAKRPSIERNETRIRFNFENGGVFIIERNRGQSMFDGWQEQFLCIDAGGGEGVFISLEETRELISWLESQCGRKES